MRKQRATKRYTYANRKGGATKSTQAINNAIASMQSGKRTLLVDFDHGQGNVTYALGYPQGELEHTVYTAMLGDSLAEQAILETYYDPSSGIFFDPHNEQKWQNLRLTSLQQAIRGPDLLPINPQQCVGTEISLVQRGDWGTLLDALLDSIEEQYDEIHIDTNPDIHHVFPRMAVNAATHIVIPSTPENWSVQGMIMLAHFLMQARPMNEAMMIAGVVFSRTRYSAHRDMMTMANEQVTPAINDLFAQTRDAYRRNNKLRFAQQLEDLHFSCFEHTIAENKEYIEQTNIRSSVMTSKKVRKTSFVPALEQWQCYIELLHRSDGSGIEQALARYNGLVTQYEQARS